MQGTVLRQGNGGSGPTMRAVTDERRVSRAKLAFIGQTRFLLCVFYLSATCVLPAFCYAFSAYLLCACCLSATHVLPNCYALSDTAVCMVLSAYAMRTQVQTSPMAAVCTHNLQY
eukprot:3422890-Rhodomonas_salina.2